jgi:tetratricopeptide (TPR) repeat protein
VSAGSAPNLDLDVDVDFDLDLDRGRRLPPWVPLLALLALACATGPRPAATPPAAAAEAPPQIRFPPEEVRVSTLDLELSGKNDEELLAIGLAADAAGDWARAAAAFARIADRFPGSKHEATALLDAGLAYMHLDEWRLALERFQALVRGWEGPDVLEASFKIADCHYFLHDLATAHAELLALAERPGLPPAQRVRALAAMGVLELEDGRPEEAERTLRKALGAWSAASEKERLDPFYAAQAEYYLGETYRGWFTALKIDPSAGDEAGLHQTLEHKAQMLLSAQGHYLRSIRMGDDRWAVASGYRVGELYDAFRQQILDAPLPPGLTEEMQQAYREQLRRWVRVLAAKAVQAYEAALGRASRSGVSQDEVRYLGEAEASLRRLEAELDEGREKSM